MSLIGLDDLKRKLQELQKVAEELDGNITNVSFEPHDPQSIDLAIQRMESAVDEKVGDYRGNNMVEDLVLAIKERYRQAIIDRAAEARAGKED
ncbi:hypothetical protein AAGW18_18675 [Vreelandella titanicae]|uniref:hypothetical protein n=1 Tax=Vreelandella titanicae TaxID=664683 RepID=UPI00241E7AB4|nr:hypothetical protein [Halomonas titanicae]